MSSFKTLHRLTFALLIVVSLGLIFLQCQSKQSPNILWLVSEDTSPDLGCYGDNVVKTPNLDQLAKQGVRFTHAYATCPVCSPSRSAFMTGMYQTSISAQQHRTDNKKTLPEPVRVITHYFRQAGYYVCNSSLNPDQPGKTDWNFLPNEEPFDGTDWSGRAEGQPFFQQINFRLTHRPFERDSLNPINPAEVDLPPYYPDHPITRRDWADYLESLQVLDRQIGLALQRLEDEGLADNTIVFYFGDHGRPHVRGKQWLYEGGIQVPLIVRFPNSRKSGTVNHRLVSLIDLAPTSIKLAGVDIPEHLQGIDIFNFWKRRRILYAARDRCDGTEDRIRCVRTHRYKLIHNYYPDRPYSQFNGYKKYRYPVLTLMHILNKRDELTEPVSRFMGTTRPEYELYDLEQDTYEINNLIDDPHYSRLTKRLQGILSSWETKYDTGIYPEDSLELEQQKQLMYDKYRERMSNQGVDPDIADEDYLQWWEMKLSEQ